MKKRDKIFVVIIISVIVIAILAVLFVYLNNKKIKDTITNSNSENNETLNEVSIIQQQAKQKYPKFEWVSDKNIGKVKLEVKNGKVYIGLKEDGTLDEINFKDGTPKYAVGILKGGILVEVAVITTDGNLYITKDTTKAGFELGKEEFEYRNLGAKVIDATYADGTDMYYLLENGKLVTKDNKEYVSFDEKAEKLQEQAKQKYPKFEWVSDKNIGKVKLEVKNEKVYIGLKEDGTLDEINFKDGTPKYAVGILKGGILVEVAVITTDGNLYITKDTTKAGFELGKEEFEYRNLGAKVIDATYADGTDMYYLLENGKLVTKDNKEYVSFDEKAEKLQEQAKQKYPKFEWVSDKNIGKVKLEVKNEKVYIGLKEDGTLDEINFKDGTPKYAVGILKGGILVEVAVITTDGNLYITKDTTKAGFELGKEEFEYRNLGAKVIDATYADGTDMYYLLENFSLVNKEYGYTQNGIRLN